MNSEQRKQLKTIIEQLEALQIELQTMADAEQEKFDNLPDGLQAAATGEKIQEAADALAGAAYGIEEAIEQVQDL